jgi:putative transposase
VKRTKFSEEKIAYILRQAEAGATALDVCRQNGISEQTFYRWKRSTAEWAWLSCGVCANWKRKTTLQTAGG